MNLLKGYINYSLGGIILKCRKCGSENVNVQVVAILKNKHHGLLYWLFIGWWLELFMWICFTLPWIIIKILKPKKYKSKVRSIAVCQDCGYKWNV